MKNLRVVLVTAPDPDTASAIAKELVSKKLAACVNVLPGLTSHYRWKGKLRADTEILLIAKTRKKAVAKLIDCVIGRHPAEVPEIIALPILEGYPPYLDWVKKSVK